MLKSRAAMAGMLSEDGSCSDLEHLCGRVEPCYHVPIRCHPVCLERALGTQMDIDVSQLTEYAQHHSVKQQQRNSWQQKSKHEG